MPISKIKVFLKILYIYLGHLIIIKYSQNLEKNAAASLKHSINLLKPTI